MLTVREAVELLCNHRITSSEQMVRRWLRQGKIKGVISQNRKVGWRICKWELLDFMESLRWAGTAYEEGIDDATKIKRLLKEIDELKLQIQELEKENAQLLDKLGIPPF